MADHTLEALITKHAYLFKRFSTDPTSGFVSKMDNSERFQLSEVLHQYEESCEALSKFGTVERGEFVPGALDRVMSRADSVGSKFLKLIRYPGEKLQDAIRAKTGKEKLASYSGAVVEQACLLAPAYLLMKNRKAGALAAYFGMNLGANITETYVKYKKAHLSVIGRTKEVIETLETLYTNSRLN